MAPQDEGSISTAPTATIDGSDDRSDDVALTPGDVLAGRYRIVKLLARGGMGAVYSADDTVLHERVALKTLRAEVAGDDRAVVRFKREIQLARRVAHGNVCRVFELGQHPRGERRDLLFLTMELLSGETLSARLARDGAMDTAAARPIAEQMVAGLTAAHDAGIIHRDLKSANVMIVPGKTGERVVVTDFGLARDPGAGGDVESTGAIVGSPGYMAPEQVEGGRIGTAADIYALGVVLYELVTGRLPFIGETPLQTAVKRLSETPAPPERHAPGLPAAWSAAIMRCLARDPAKRFTAARDVLAALDGVAAPRRKRWLIAACLAGLLVAGAGAAVFALRTAPVDREVDDQMGEVQLLIDLTHYAAAVERAQALEQRLATSTDEVRRGRASLLLARSRLELGELVLAEAPLREAIRLAARVGDDSTLAQCWVLLVRLLTQVGRMPEALTIADVAEAAVVRAGNDPRLSLQLQTNLAWAEGWEDLYSRSIKRARDAITAAESVFGAQDPDVIGARLVLAEHQIDVGDPASGEATARDALKAAEQAFGDDDFRAAIARFAIGMARRDAGDLATARVMLERAAVDATALDERHPARFHATAELGRLYLIAGENGRARDVLEHALTMARALHGPDGVRIGLALGYVGDVNVALRDFEAAERLWTEALVVRGRTRGESSFSAGRAHAMLGLIAVARNDRTGAIEHLERAVAILGSSEVTAATAVARARLGRLLWERPETRARARELAGLAKPALRATPGDLVFDLVELQRFVDEATR